MAYFVTYVSYLSSHHHNERFATFFLLLGPPDHMVRAKKMLVDIEEHCLTLLCTFSLFQVNICIDIHEHLSKNLIHQGIVCITMVVMINPVQQFLIQVKV